MLRFDDRPAVDTSRPSALFKRDSESTQSYRRTYRQSSPSSKKTSTAKPSTRHGLSSLNGLPRESANGRSRPNSPPCGAVHRVKRASSPSRALLDAARTGPGIGGLLSALENGADLDTVDTAGLSAITLCCIRGDLAAVELLVSRGCSTLCPQVKQKNVLNIALETQRADICLALVQAGAEVDVRSLELLHAFQSSSKWSRFEPVLKAVIFRTSGSEPGRRARSVRACSTTLPVASPEVQSPASQAQSPEHEQHSPQSASTSPSPRDTNRWPCSPRMHRLHKTDSTVSEASSPPDEPERSNEPLSPPLSPESLSHRKVAILQKLLVQRMRTAGQLMYAGDSNRDNKLNLDEFCRGVAMMGLRPLPSTAEMNAIFDAYDQDGDGFIEWTELQSPPVTTQSPVPAQTSRRARRLPGGSPSLPDAFKQATLTVAPEKDVGVVEEGRAVEAVLEEGLWSDQSAAAQYNDKEGNLHAQRPPHGSSSLQQKHSSAEEEPQAQDPAALMKLQLDASVSEHAQQSIRTQLQRSQLEGSNTQQQQRSASQDVREMQSRLTAAPSPSPLDDPDTELNKLKARLLSHPRHIANPVTSPVADRLANARRHFENYNSTAANNEFNQWDVNRDGVIDRNEFSAAIAKLKLDATVSSDTQDTIVASLLRTKLNSCGDQEVAEMDAEPRFAYSTMYSEVFEGKNGTSGTSQASYTAAEGSPQTQLTMFGLEAAAALDHAMAVVRRQRKHTESGSVLALHSRLRGLADRVEDMLMCAGIPHPQHWQHATVLAGVRGLSRDLGAVTAQSARQFSNSNHQWWPEVQADILEAQAGLGRSLMAALQGWAVSEVEDHDVYVPLEVEMATIPHTYVNSRPYLAAPPVVASPAAASPAAGAHESPTKSRTAAQVGISNILRVDTTGGHLSYSPAQSLSPPTFDILLTSAPDPLRTRSTPSKKKTNQTQLSPTEKRRGMAANLQQRLKKRGRTPAQLFYAADANRDNKLNFDEFCRGVAMMGVRPLPRVHQMRALFDEWDYDGDGWLQWDELDSVFSRPFA